MVELNRIFQTRDQALEAYKTQLSHQELFVEVFEALSAGTEVSLTLTIRETKQTITLPATVKKMFRKKEAVEMGYGMRAGVILSIVFTPEIIEPFRAFFLAGAPSSTSSLDRSGEQKGEPHLHQATPLNEPNDLTRRDRTRYSTVRGPVTKLETPKTTQTPFRDLAQKNETDIKVELTRTEQQACSGNLFSLFGLDSRCDRKDIRRVYNEIVRNLHPDTYPVDLSKDTVHRLELAYQTYNDAYQIIQHNVKRDIYMDVSRSEGRPGGLSLEKYVAWQAAYAQKNNAGIQMAASLSAQARESKLAGLMDQARQQLTLALKYDPFCIDARSMELE